MKHGLQTETTEIDDNGSTISRIEKVRDSEVKKVYKQYKIRNKVYSQKEQLTEYVKHADKVLELHKEGKLVIKDNDPMLYPAFWSEYPKFDQDGSWFVISSYTIIV